SAIHTYSSWTSCAYKRHRRSFPTRRSSDLAHIGEHAGSEQRLDAIVDIGAGEGLAGLDPHMVADRVRIHAGIPANLDPADYSSLDRKSTRLNSSHVKISYAVFCLKKKKFS